MKRFQHIGLTLLLFLGTFSIGFIVLQLIETRYVANLNSTARTLGVTFAKQIQQHLDHSFSAVYTLASIVKQYKQVADFPALASDVIKSHQNIDNLQLAPNGIVTQIYPQQGNEAAIGHNLLTDPLRRADAFKAINSRKLTLTGPVNLIQGGYAIIGRYPVFEDEGSSDEVFWGFTIALVNLSTLIRSTGVDELLKLGYQFELTRIDPDSGKEIKFHQSSKIEIIDKISTLIEVPNGYWRLNLSNPDQSRQWFFVAAIVLLVIGSSTVALLGRHYFISHGLDIELLDPQPWRTLLAILATCSIFGTVWLLEVIAVEKNRSNEQSNVLRELSTVRTKLEHALNERLFLTKGMTSYVKVNPEINYREFEALASNMVHGISGIRSLQLAKNTVVTHVYPLRGNEQALGLELLKIPEQRGAVERALETQNTVVAGPVSLIQSGLAFISRTPIYLNQLSEETTADSYWGLATIIINRDTLFEEAGLLGAQPIIKIALRGQDASGNKGKIFFGDENIFNHQPVTVDVSLPNGSWQLAAIPIKGWGAQASPYLLLRTGGFIIAAMIGILVWFLLSFQIKLRESEQRFRTMVEHLPAGTAYIENDHIIMNRGLEDITGYLREEISTVQQWFDRLCGNQSNYFKSKYDKGVKSQTPVTQEIKIITRNQQTRHLEFSVYRDPHFEIWLLQDITDRKHEESENENLKHQLIQAQKMETIGTLAGGIAHDFNNILSPILGYADICQNSHLDESKKQNYLRQITKAALVARDLIKQLLAFSRPETLEISPIHFGKTVKESMKLVRMSIPSTIEVIDQIEDESTTILANPSQIEQIVINITTNAFQAMPKGGKLIAAIKKTNPSSEFLQIHPDFEPTENLKLSIIDNGIGMDQDTLARIYEPFFSTKEVGDGSGLGLSVVHGIVKSLGGILDVNSKKGIGTTFNIYFPTTVKTPAKSLHGSLQPNRGTSEFSLLTTIRNSSIC